MKCNPKSVSIILKWQRYIIMFIVICYDIVSDFRRAKLSKYLLNYGVRAQKSVFECILDQRQYEKVKKGALKFIDEDEDNLRFYHLCQNCLEKVEVFGETVLTEEEEVIIV